MENLIYISGSSSLGTWEETFMSSRDDFVI